MSKLKKSEIQLDYVNYIFNPPNSPKQMFKTAAGGDDITVEAMGPLWLGNIEANRKKYGSFADKSIGQFFNDAKFQPVICVGSGPSLKRNGHELKDRKGIKAISCLHNFHFFADRDIDIDYYVSLDAQELTVEEVSEGGEHDPEWYWERTEGKTLFAYAGSHPKLLEKWRGKVYFFNCPIPDVALDQKISDLCDLSVFVSPGGNVLGACVYIAKAILGANPIVFMGADFCFSYDKKFHGWNSKYDKDMGSYVRSVDVFGNKVYTWMSYHGFKNYFEWLSIQVPGLYINCTEGGTLGAYPDGNLISIQQMDFEDFLKMYTLNDGIKNVITDPNNKEKLVLY